MKKAIGQFFAKMFNKTLALDPETQTQWKDLEGHVITLDFTGLSVFTIEIVHEGICMIETDSSKPDVTLRGTPLSFLNLLMSHRQKKPLVNPDVSIEGNLSLLQQVMNVMEQLQIDWEDVLSRWIGEMPAYHVGRFARGATQWSQRAFQSMTQNINEYVHEEVKWFPTRFALHDFFEEVDRLREDVDRLTAKIDAIWTFTQKRMHS